jgi:aryl-alcohol dehydrogenase-like predicted oxidoreductase
VVATKYTSNMGPDDPNAGGNQRKNMIQSLDASLRRLGTDYVDIYWVHAWDPMTPIEELMRALDDAVRSGKVLYVGISDAPAWVVSRANTLAETRGWSPFAGLQIPYSLIERTSERELLPMAEALDIAVTAWAPIGGGVLAGKYASKERRPEGARFSSSNPWSDAYLTDRNLRIAEEVLRLAREIGRTPSQVAIAWVRQQQKGVVVPIIGARTLGQMRDNLGCLDLTLSSDQLQRLDRVSHIEPGFPTDFLVRVRGIVYGNTFDLTDDHRRRA